MRTQDIAWLAGIVEGEGCLTPLSHPNKPCWPYRPSIRVSMNDKDIVERVATLFSTKLLGPYLKNGIQNKPSYLAQINGKRAVGFMLTIFPFLGTRRRAKIVDVLSKWNTER